MQIIQIYKKYNINSGLQKHMVRVAAVAQKICNHTNRSVDTYTTVSACLLHDLGNLIKSNLDTRPELFEPEGIKYWSEVQERMIQTYGLDVHRATTEMVEDLAPHQSIINTVKSAAFTSMEEVCMHGSVETKILEYADMRVAIDGIVSLDDRFADIRKRYVPVKLSEATIERLYTATVAIEEELFGSVPFAPHDITDATTEDMQTELWSWKLETNVST